MKYLWRGERHLITVGGNRAENLTGGLRIDSGYCESVGAEFWLRAPDITAADPTNAMTVKSMGSIYGWVPWSLEARNTAAVVPAFEFNLSSVSSRLPRQQQHLTGH